MKNKLWTAAALALCFSLFSCEKTPEKQDEPTEPTFSAPVLSIANTADGLSFTWTAACDSKSEKVIYDVYYGPSTIDLFTNGKKFEAGEALSCTISKDELTQILLNEFSCRNGETVTIQAIVYATAKKNQTSNIANVDFQIPEAEIVKPSSLYIVGGAIDDAWSLAIELPKKADGVYEASDIELKLGKIEDNKGFKFLTAIGVWYPFYGQKVGESFGKTAIFATEADGDSQFYPLTAGYTSGVYTVNVNLNTMETTLTKTGDIYEFDKTTAIYIVGDGMTNSWDMVEANALVKVADSRYEAKDIRIAPDSKFKFSTWNWETEYVRKEGAGSYWTAEVKSGTIGDIRFVPSEADAAFKTGEYTVSLDIKTGEVKLTLTKEEVIAKCIYMFGPATEAGWDTAKFIPVNEISADVYEASGVAINVGAANADDPKGNGFKFSETRGWDRQWGAKESFDGGYRGWEIGDMSSDANQFYPLLMDLTSGNYTVKVDLGNKKVTLTKE